jgi:signal peptidase I
MKLKSWLKENRGFIVLLLCLGVFRTAVADWNPIPSGSMRPTLLEGDVVFVDRLAYDLKLPLTDITVARIGEPQRGDIVTFSSPKDGIRLIKRLVALPGDRVEMRHEVLFVNGEAAQYRDLAPAPEPLANGGSVTAWRGVERVGKKEHRIQFLAGVPAANSFPLMVVPADEYLMLGDNRDNSADSRYFGFVPRRLLIGQAKFILASADIQDSWLPRLARFAAPLQ